MNLSPETINLTFVILGTKGNLASINLTKKKLDAKVPNKNIFCVVKNNCKGDDLKQLSKIVDVYQYGKTDIDLINLGMIKSNADWVIFLEEGNVIHYNSIRKICNFIHSEKDIIYGIKVSLDKINIKNIKDYIGFDRSCLSGLTINTKTFKTVGKLSNLEPTLAKTIWFNKAKELGCNFKGIVGLKII